MEQNIKGFMNSFSCELCKMKFSSHADYVLHEFSKKHCDNLIKLAKNKSIPQKQKKMKRELHPETEVPSIKNFIQPEPLPKYGYFVPKEIYTTSEGQKGDNTNFDCYLQNFTENPHKESNTITPVIESQALSKGRSSATFSRKKRKKTRTCHICNVTLVSVPEYDAHMKSPQHIWKLKMSGMGVSAHFVKASSNLHTTDINESNKLTNQTLVESVSKVSAAKESFTLPFPLLYCSDCELLLNSPQQYNTHVIGKAHIECAQRRAGIKAKKEKASNPAFSQWHCYSCQISLNNLFQYNEHKNGKKHLNKCRQLIKRGIMIPPEEEVSGLKLPRISNKHIYPELHEKFVLEEQKEKKLTDNVSKLNTTNFCNKCNLNFTSATEYDLHFQISHKINLSNYENNSNNNNDININNNGDNCNTSIKTTELKNNLEINDKSSEGVK